MNALHIKNLRGVFSGKTFNKSSDVFLDSSGKISASLAPDSLLFDASNLVALPGFIDSHTHSIFAGTRSKEYFMRWQGQTYVEIAKAGGGILSTVAATKLASDDHLIDLFRSRAAFFLRSGVTTLETKSGYGGSDPEQELRLLRLIKRAASTSNIPQVFSSFLGLHALPKNALESHFVDSMISILPIIEKENLASFVDAFPEDGFFSLSESLRFVRAGQKHGLKAKIHADEITDVGASLAFINEGAVSIDHLQQINNEAIAALARANTVATLLPATSFYLGLPYANAQKLIRAGAKVALATDFNPGTAPSMDFGFTLLLAATQLKMGVWDIFQAATQNAAQAMGLSDRGIVQNGMRGDLVFYEFPQELASPESYLEEIILYRKKPAAVLLGSNPGSPVLFS